MCDRCSVVRSHALSTPPTAARAVAPLRPLGKDPLPQFFGTVSACPHPVLAPASHQLGRGARSAAELALNLLALALVRIHPPIRK